MPRFIAALIIGIGALVNGWSRLGTPATAAEKSAWIYKTFGPEGFAWGMMALGAVMLLVGISLMRRWLVAMKTARME